MKAKRVLVDSELAPVVLDLFQAAKLEADVIAPRPQIVETLVQHGEYAALLLRSQIVVPSSALEVAPKSLKVIGIVGDSLDNISIEDASNRGILVKAADYVNAYETANATIKLAVLLLSRGFRHREADQAWVIDDIHGLTADDLTGFELAGKTLGLIGCGKVAQALAKQVEPYCGRIIGYDNHPRHVFETFHRRSPLECPVIEYAQLSEVLEYSDVISIHTAGDDRVFKGNELYFAKKRPFIVHTARSGNVDEASLLSALQDKRVRGAAMTLPSEQLRKGEFDAWVRPFQAMSNVIIAPAVGDPTAETKKKNVRRLAQSVIGFLLDKDLSLAVNPMDALVGRRKTRYPISRGRRRAAIPVLLGH
jgi:D-3-phosphoglycerate dehydrogenase